MLAARCHRADAAIAARDSAAEAAQRTVDHGGGRLIRDTAIAGQRWSAYLDSMILPRGAAWIDPACWVVWLVFAGHNPHEAEQWAAKVPCVIGGQADGTRRGLV